MNSLDVVIDAREVEGKGLDTVGFPGGFPVTWEPHIQLFCHVPGSVQSLSWDQGAKWHAVRATFVERDVLVQSKTRIACVERVMTEAKAYYQVIRVLEAQFP